LPLLSVLALTAPLPAGSRAPARVAARIERDAGQARASAVYGRLPLAFERNRGQAAPDVDFVARGAGYGLP
jgi:hypothetical protein